MKKLTTKQRAERQEKSKTKREAKSAERKLLHERANSAYVSVQDFCRTHKFSARIFLAELRRQNLPTIDFIGESTKGQTARGVKKEVADEVLRALRKTFTIREDEITLADLAAKLGLNVNALRERLKNRGIEGRVVRYEDDNAKVNHQPTTAYRLDDEAVLALKKEVKALKPIEVGEVTLRELQDRLGISKRALYARIKVRGIKGRNSRYPADENNKALRSQPCTVYREVDVPFLFAAASKKEGAA